MLKVLEKKTIVQVRNSDLNKEEDNRKFKKRTIQT